MWKPRVQPADFETIVASIYGSMEEAAKPAFTDSDLRCVHSIVRLTVDFYNYLETVDVTSPNKGDIRFACESILSGIDSFTVVNNSYRILVGSKSSALRLETALFHFLRERFISIYQEFLSEAVFENKCRLLLDLFKLQIVFVGMQYD
jgi:hypothetical protein